MADKSPPLDVEKVILAIDELRRWEARRAELAADPRGGAANAAEVARARKQVAYYGGLLQDMKRHAHPDSVPRFIGRMGSRNSTR